MTIPPIHITTGARVVHEEREIARSEAATVTSTLSPESARLVRIERIMRDQPNPADQARARGFYDFMLGRPSQGAGLGVRLAVSYQQGWTKGQQRRVALNGRAWYETEKIRNGGRWSWRIYREGHFQLEGNASSETRADQQIEDSKADLMDRHDDWGTPRGLAEHADHPEHVDEDAAPCPRL